MRRCGCPAAVPFFDIVLEDTIATYNANWLDEGEKVAYRHVWKYTDANGTVSYGAVSDQMQLENTAVSARSGKLTMSLPMDIISATEIARYSVEIYRTATITPSINGITADPGDEMFLVQELRPTSADIANGYLVFIDILPPDMLQTALHTNETQ